MRLLAMVEDPANVARVDDAPATSLGCSPAPLIRMKDTPRPQDAIDRAFLEGVLREREGQRRPR
jgi:hypothetical protein